MQATVAYFTTKLYQQPKFIREQPFEADEKILKKSAIVPPEQY
jgi:hypothetical protein